MNSSSADYLCSRLALQLPCSVTLEPHRGLEPRSPLRNEQRTCPSGAHSGTHAFSGSTVQRSERPRSSTTEARVTRPGCLASAR